MTAIYVVIGLVAGGICYFIEKIILILATSIGGAFMVVVSTLLIFTPPQIITDEDGDY
jgi:hypothetical protein